MFPSASEVGRSFVFVESFVNYGCLLRLWTKVEAEPLWG